MTKPALSDDALTVLEALVNDVEGNGIDADQFGWTPIRMAKAVAEIRLQGVDIEANSIH